MHSNGLPLKPPSLKAGDTIAVLSPCSGLAYTFPYVYDLGLENLRNTFGVNILEMPTAMMDNDTLYASPEKRAQDINNAFANPKVNAIIVTIGGDDSVRILEYLDIELILKNPKIIMGYSDATTFLTYLNQKGLVTFNGPAVMAGFAQLQAYPKHVTEHIRRMLMTQIARYSLPYFEGYTERYLNWQTPENAGQVEPLKKDDIGWQWIQGQGKVEGRLFGGCIEVLEFLKATKYWPEPAFWDDKILYFETSENAPSIDCVKYFLRNYGTQGIFGRVKGILFGRARDYSNENKLALIDMIRKVLDVEFKQADLPVVANLTFGHTDPQWVMPNGILTEINCDEKTISLLESPTC